MNLSYYITTNAYTYMKTNKYTANKHTGTVCFFVFIFDQKKLVTKTKKTWMKTQNKESTLNKILKFSVASLFLKCNCK